MFPMVATVEEFDEAKSLVERELTHLRRHSHKLPERVEVEVYSDEDGEYVGEIREARVLDAELFPTD